MFCVYCGREISETAHFCPYCGKVVPHAVREERAMRQAQPVSPALPMNWWRFLTSFGLFALAAMFVLNAVLLLSGLSYGEAADRIYREFGGVLTGLDVATGVVLVILAALAVFARFRLAGRHKDGPLCLYLTFGTWALLQAAHMAAAIALAVRTGHSVTELTLVPALYCTIAAAVALCLSLPYFKRRRERFVN